MQAIYILRHKCEVGIMPRQARQREMSSIRGGTKIGALSTIFAPSLRCWMAAVLLSRAESQAGEGKLPPVPHAMQQLITRNPQRACPVIDDAWYGPVSPLWLTLIGVPVPPATRIRSR